MIKENIELIIEEIRFNLEKQMTYVYENYDGESFADYINSLTEEELEILGLNEKSSSDLGIMDRVNIAMKSREKIQSREVPAEKIQSREGLPTKIAKAAGPPTESIKAREPQQFSSGANIGTNRGGGIRGDARRNSAPSSRGSTSTGALPGGGIRGDARRNVAPGGGSTANIRPQGRAGGGLTALQGHGGGKKVPDSTQALRDVLNQKAQARKSASSQSKTPKVRSAVKPASRPVSRPSVRPKTTKTPKTTAAQDFMANFQREESRPQIKESFEQFIRHKFLKG